MRRHNYELFMKNSYVGLLADCVYKCFQESDITDDEFYFLDCFLKKMYLLNEVDIPDFMKREFNNN